MTVKLYAMTCGHVTGSFARLMEGGEGDITLPIPSYLIEHKKGSSAVRHRHASGFASNDPEPRVGIAARQTVPLRLTDPARRSAPGSSRSAAIPTKIDLIVNSHLHFNHVGGNE